MTEQLSDSNASANTATSVKQKRSCQTSNSRLTRPDAMTRLGMGLRVSETNFKMEDIRESSTRRHCATSVRTTSTKQRCNYATK